MASSDSDDRLKAVRENGQEREQKTKLRELADRMDKNDADHGSIMDILTRMERTIEVQVERLQGKIASHRMVAVTVWGIFVVLGGWMVSRAGHVVDRLIDKVNAIEVQSTSEVSAIKERDADLKEAIGVVRDKHHHDMDKINEDIRKIRRGKRQLESE